MTHGTGQDCGGVRGRIRLRVGQSSHVLIELETTRMCKGLKACRAIGRASDWALNMRWACSLCADSKTPLFDSQTTHPRFWKASELKA